MTPLLQEKPSLGPVAGRIVTSGEQEPAEGVEVRAPSYRARVTLPDPTVAMIELLSPGSVLTSDMSLPEMGRH